MRSIKYGTMVVGTLWALTGPASATVITIQGNTVNGPSNCYPFGAGLSSFGPFAGFVYKNIPAFAINPGDKIAFDLGAVNDNAIVLDIAMAHTISSGSDQPDAAGFTTVVSAGSPTGMGDTVAGNYDLVFTAQAAFNFAGGGLIIRFAPQGSFAASDSSCTQVLEWSTASDSSGLFVERFYRDADGAFPWTSTDVSSIGIVRITTSVVAVANGPYVGMVGAPIALSGTGSTSTAGPIVLYEWDCTSDGVYDTSMMTAAGGTCTYGAVGSYTATLRATDSTGGTATATATVTVITPPTISPTSASIAPRGTQTFTASSGSGTGYSFALTTNASGGTIGATTGIYVAGTTGSVTDVVTLTDSNNLTATANITVGPRVTLSPASPSAPPRGTVNFSASGGSGTGYSYARAPGGSGGTINASTGVYVAGSTGSTSDMVTVTDSLGNTATVSVSVGAGVALSPAAPSTPPRGSVTFTAMGGSGSFTYALLTNNSGGSVTTGGIYTAGNTGSVSDTVRVTDSLGNIASASITVGPRVAVTPSAPSLAPGASVTLAVSGGSGTGYAFAVTTNGSSGSVNAAGKYTAGAVGSSTDVVTITDSLGNTATTTVTVGPGVSVTPASPSLAPRGALDFTASGGSGTGFVWTLATAASGGAINASSAHYTAGATGSVTDDVVVTDSLGNTAHVHVAVTAGVGVTPAVPMTPPRGTLTFGATGGSGTGFTWALTTNHSGGSLSTGGAYTAGATGQTSDTITVTDSLGNTATVSVSVGAGITLNPAAPMAPPLGSVAFTAMGGSGSGYTYAVTTGGSHGAIDTQGAYTAGTTGSVSDTVTVTDSLGNTATATVQVGPGLSITPAQGNLAPRGTLALAISGGSGAGYAWSLTTNGSGASIDAATGDYTAGATGDSTDVAQVIDSLGNTATISITVGPTVTLLAASATVSPRGTVLFTASAGSGGYVYTIATDGSGSASVNSSTGEYIAGATPNVNDVVRVVDSNGNSATLGVAVGAGVAVTPGNPATAPRGSIAFAASGGSGSGFIWTLSDNRSGGQVDSTGHYTAGIIGNATDMVTATDSLGNSSTVSVSVGGGLGINPAAPAVSPRGSVALAVTGGSGSGFAWVLSTNASGGTIDGTTGAYTAGVLGGVTDIATVSDSFGNAATVSITVGPQVTIQPPNAAAQTSAQVLFAVMGGSGSGHAWTLPTNASGATIDASTGAYKAGTVGGTDVVRVTDSLGNSADAHVTVTAVATHTDGGAPDSGDAGVHDASTDSGTTAHGGGGGGGCGCDVGGTVPSGTGLGLAILALLLLRPGRAARSRSDRRLP